MFGLDFPGGATGSTVFWTPAQPTINDSITIYVVSAQGANLHWGVNYTGASWQAPNNVYWPAGTSLYTGGTAVESPFSTPVNDTIKIKIGPFNKAAQSVSKIAFVIHYNDNTWDNNSGSDYHIDLSGVSTVIPFIMDGSVDTSAVKIATNNGMDLYAGWNGSDLYVATQSAPSAGNDVFIFVTDSLKSLVAAPWAKSGQATQWSAFLANESSNNYNAWTGVTGSLQNYSGNFLEGSINLQSQFGYIPSKIYISAARYQTADGGTLAKQVPTGNGNGNLEAGEFYTYNFAGSSIVLTITALIQGLYNGSTMISDTVTVELHNSSSPYSLVEAQKGVLNTSGTGTFYFSNAVIDTPYYIVVKHRNSIETWSATPQIFRTGQ